MYQKEVTVINKSGLHARPAAEFSRAASMFRSSVHAVYKGQRINAKSIVNILAGGIVQGSCIMLEAEGPDEFIAVETLAALVENGLGEAR
ncbi:MAG TPA: HPr family phosphocarrier protein [Anaerovoracaceae bacterium]|nr:HPr family phosphocarrier protein [Anaerovoracaceae bacterium]